MLMWSFKVWRWQGDTRFYFLRSSSYARKKDVLVIGCWHVATPEVRQLLAKLSERDGKIAELTLKLEARCHISEQKDLRLFTPRRFASPFASSEVGTLYFQVTSVMKLFCTLRAFSESLTKKRLHYYPVWFVAFLTRHLTNAESAWIRKLLNGCWCLWSPRQKLANRGKILDELLSNVHRASATICMWRKDLQSQVFACSPITTGPTTLNIDGNCELLHPDFVILVNSTDP